MVLESPTEEEIKVLILGWCEQEKGSETGWEYSGKINSKQATATAIQKGMCESNLTMLAVLIISQISAISGLLYHLASLKAIRFKWIYRIFNISLNGLKM